MPVDALNKTNKVLWKANNLILMLFRLTQELKGLIHDSGCSAICVGTFGSTWHDVFESNSRGGVMTQIFQRVRERVRLTVITTLVPRANEEFS